MKKLAIIGLLIFEVVLCGAAIEPHIPTLKICDPMAHIQCIAVTAVPEEPKEEPIIEEPLTTEELIIREAEAAGIDPSLAVAISKLETGHWTSDAYLYGNNVGGMSRREIPMTFASLDEGINAFIACLETYFDKGLNTPETMAPVYCPVDPYGWAAKVRSLSDD